MAHMAFIQACSSPKLYYHEAIGFGKRCLKKLCCSMICFQFHAQYRNTLFVLYCWSLVLLVHIVGITWMNIRVENLCI